MSYHNLGIKRLQTHSCMFKSVIIDNIYHRTCLLALSPWLLPSKFLPSLADNPLIPSSPDPRIGPKEMYTFHSKNYFSPVFLLDILISSFQVSSSYPFSPFSFSHSPWWLLYFLVYKWASSSCGWYMNQKMHICFFSSTDTSAQKLNQ